MKEFEITDSSPKGKKGPIKLCRLAPIFVLLVTPPLETFQELTRTQLLMGDIPVSITIETSRRERAYATMEKAFREARRIESEVSEWRTESQTTLLNDHAGGAWIPIGKDLLTILSRAQEVSELTAGAFDVTFASPDRTATFQDLQLLPDLHLARLRRKGVKIGVSGIAKGYIVDRMSEVLKEGFRKFLINAGDLYASGEWEVGIRDPQNPAGLPICRVKVKDRAVSTSGNYERGPHLVEPKSRSPASSLKSATVIGRDSTTADALATAFFVLGLEKSRTILRSHPNLSVLFVSDGGCARNDR